MTVDELGQATKAKHSEYANLSDSEVGARVLAKYPEYRSQISQPEMGGKPPIGAAIDFAESLTPANKIGKGLKDFAGSAAEKLGGAGVNPYLSAALTTPIAIAPDIVSAVGGISALEGDTPLAKALTNTPKMLGKEYSTLEENAGLSRKLPVQRGFEAKPSAAIGGNPPPTVELPYKPESYPKDTNSLLNFVKDRIDNFGSELSPQELTDYKTMLNSNLSAMQAKGLSGTKPFAFASDLQRQVSDLHNAAIPGRADLNKAYALSKSIRDIPSKVGSAAKTTAKIGALLGSGGLLYKLLNQ